MASIIVLSGPNKGDYSGLDTSDIVIGRDESCPIQIVDELVSRKHVRIRFNKKSKGYVATDMNSANGLKINTRPITTDTPLTDGDVLQIGSSLLMFTATSFSDKQSAMDYAVRAAQRFKSTLMQ